MFEGSVPHFPGILWFWEGAVIQHLSAKDLSLFLFKNDLFGTEFEMKFIEVY